MNEIKYLNKIADKILDLRLETFVALQIARPNGVARLQRKTWEEISLKK